MLLVLMIFCTELNRVFSDFCHDLTVRLSQNINNFINLMLLQQFTYTPDRIRTLFYYNNCEHIYENWKELILLDIIELNQNNQYFLQVNQTTILNDINKIIFDTIIDITYKYSSNDTTEFYYNADTDGFLYVKVK